MLPGAIRVSGHGANAEPVPPTVKSWTFDTVKRKEARGNLDPAVPVVPFQMSSPGDNRDSRVMT